MGNRASCSGALGGCGGGGGGGNESAKANKLDVETWLAHKKQKSEGKRGASCCGALKGVSSEDGSRGIMFMEDDEEDGGGYGMYGRGAAEYGRGVDWSDCSDEDIEFGNQTWEIPRAVLTDIFFQIVEIFDNIHTKMKILLKYPHNRLLCGNPQ